MFSADCSFHRAGSAARKMARKESWRVPYARSTYPPGDFIARAKYALGGTAARPRPVRLPGARSTHVLSKVGFAFAWIRQPRRWLYCAPMAADARWASRSRTAGLGRLSRRRGEGKRRGNGQGRAGGPPYKRQAG